MRSCFLERLGGDVLGTEQKFERSCRLWRPRLHRLVIAFRGEVIAVAVRW